MGGIRPAVRSNSRASWPRFASLAILPNAGANVRRIGRNRAGKLASRARTGKAQSGGTACVSARNQGVALNEESGRGEDMALRQLLIYAKLPLRLHQPGQLTGGGASG